MNDPFSMDRFTVEKNLKEENQWSTQLERFAVILNHSRQNAGYKPMSYGEIGKRLKRSGVSNVEDANIFFRKCEGFDHFSKGFLYLTK